MFSIKTETKDQQRLLNLSRQSVLERVGKMLKRNYESSLEAGYKRPEY